MLVAAATQWLIDSLMSSSRVRRLSISISMDFQEPSEARSGEVPRVDPEEGKRGRQFQERRITGKQSYGWLVTWLLISAFINFQGPSEWRSGDIQRMEPEGGQKSFKENEGSEGQCTGRRSE